MTDSIHSVVKEIASTPASSHNVWLYIAVLEFVVILILIARISTSRKHQSEKDKTKEQILHEGDIDFSNLIDSSFKAKPLYDDLKKKCHPDRFPNDEAFNAKATEIFSLLVKNKHNYKALCELKERAEKELNINF